jgi:glyoxylase-like metal-dependent hydrolase (beta-lactamase superfamily II)
MLRVGNIEIIRIEELVLMEPTNLFAGWNKDIADKEIGWLSPNYYDPTADAFITSVHSWLIKTPHHTIIVDTGAGNGKDRPASPRFGNLNTPYLERLRNAGVAPERVHYVINTHLHVDHVGWNTIREGDRWVPTFPNARYILPRLEVETRDPKRGASNKPPASHKPFLDSVLPVIEAGLATLVDGNERLLDEIDLVPTPGHAPGQMAVRVQSEGAEALFIADVMHQPVQIKYPDWNSKYCENPVAARHTRMRILEYAADRGSLLLPVHFGSPYCGRVARRGGTFTFLPSEENP